MSLDLMASLGLFKEKLGIDLPATVFFEHPTAESLLHFIREIRGLPGSPYRIKTRRKSLFDRYPFLVLFFLLACSVF